MYSWRSDVVSELRELWSLCILEMSIVGAPQPGVQDIQGCFHVTTDDVLKLLRPPPATFRSQAGNGCSPEAHLVASDISGETVVIFS